VPDIVACYRGKFIGIECKTGTKQPTALQNRELDRIVEAGGVSLVVREANISDVTEVLDFIDKENR
jgi:Holliday junction resolvase